MKKISAFLSESFHFSVVKFSVYWIGMFSRKSETVVCEAVYAPSAGLSGIRFSK